jgi:hypothetical protein
MASYNDDELDAVEELKEAAALVGMKTLGSQETKNGSGGEKPSMEGELAMKSAEIVIENELAAERQAEIMRGQK